MHDVDPEESAKVLRSVRERQRSLWANTVVTADVTSAMILHRDGGVCMCDKCDTARPQRQVGAILRNTNHRRLPGPGSMIRRRPVLAVDPPGLDVGSPPRPRYMIYMNQPVRAPIYTTLIGKLVGK